MCILTSTPSNLEFKSVNQASIYENSELSFKVKNLIIDQKIY